jgi:hypothetical protein
MASVGGDGNAHYSSNSADAFRSVLETIGTQTNTTSSGVMNA